MRAFMCTRIIGFHPGIVHTSSLIERQKLRLRTRLEHHSTFWAKQRAVMLCIFRRTTHFKWWRADDWWMSWSTKSNALNFLFELNQLSLSAKTTIIIHLFYCNSLAWSVESELCKFFLCTSFFFKYCCVHSFLHFQFLHKFLQTKMVLRAPLRINFSRRSSFCSRFLHDSEFQCVTQIWWRVIE